MLVIPLKSTHCSVQLCRLLRCFVLLYCSLSPPCGPWCLVCGLPVIARLRPDEDDNEGWTMDRQDTGDGGDRDLFTGVTGAFVVHLFACDDNERGNTT